MKRDSTSTYRPPMLLLVGALGLAVGLAIGRISVQSEAAAPDAGCARPNDAKLGDAGVSEGSSDRDSGGVDVALPEDEAAPAPSAPEYREPEDTTAWRPSDPTFTQVVRELKRIGLKPVSEDSAVLGEAAMNKRLLDPTAAVPAIYQYWLQGNFESVELQWWRRGDRLTRVFVLMLFYCGYGPEGQLMSNFPTFRAERFSEPARTERQEEIEFVKRYQSALAQIVVDVFSGAPEDVPRYDVFRTVAGQPGEPLPRNVDALFRE